MQGLPGVLAAGLLCPHPKGHEQLSLWGGQGGELGNGGQLHRAFSPSAPSGDVPSERWIPGGHGQGSRRPWDSVPPSPGTGRPPPPRRLPHSRVCLQAPKPKPRKSISSPLTLGRISRAERLESDFLISFSGPHGFWLGDLELVPSPL